MGTKTTELLGALRAAMQGERTGHEFYKVAAASTKDPQGKKVFKQLAEEELAHFDFLRQHLQSVTEKGELASGLTLGEAHALATDHPIFSADFKRRIKEAHFEMSALAIAVQLELNAINLYREQAAKAPHAEARKLFESLVEWESGHYDALIRQQQELQEAYWNEAGFAPF